MSIGNKEVATVYSKISELHNNKYQMFDTKVSKEKDILEMVSFNKDDLGSIWNAYEWDEECEGFEGFTGRYIPFACSGAGDEICFDTSNNHVVYIYHETAEDTFTEFINSLYDDDF